MKKLLLLMAIALMSLTTRADEGNSHLVFRTIDGNAYSITALGVDITFADGNMVATNADETVTLPLASLASMEFGDQVTSLTDIAADFDGAVAVAGLGGQAFGTYASMAEARRLLAPGIYVAANQAGQTIKFIVSK